MNRRDWRDGLLLGAALGAVILGICGRIVMRIAALAVEQDPVFTLRGTTTVVGAGTITGAAAAAVFLGTTSLFRARRIVRTVAFWIASLALALAILWPVNRLRLELFLPLAAIYAASLQLVWSRRARRISPSSTVP